MLNVQTSPKDEFLQQTEYILSRVIETRNFDIGFDFVKSLIDGKDVIEKSAALVLDGMDKEWIPSEHEGESFFDATYRKTGLSPITIGNKLSVQKLLNSDAIPEEYREQIESLDMKSLVRISKTVEQGYEVDKNDWKRWSDTPGNTEVERIAREITGKPPRSNFVSFFFDEHGIVYSHVNGRVVEAGRLSLDDDPDVLKAIEVWKARSKMTPKVNY